MNEDTPQKGCQYISDLGEFLVKRARTADVGEMVSIVAKTPLGIEWSSSLKGDWFMQTPSIESLVRNWDGVSSVYWFWDAYFKDGSEVKAHVFVPPSMMQEIKNWLLEEP